MGNLNQFKRPLPNALSSERGYSPLGYHIMHVTARSDYTTPSVMKGTILDTVPFLAVEGGR